MKKSLEKNKINKMIDILELVDVKFMQNVQDFISKTMDVALLSVDHNNQSLTTPSNFSDFCIKYARGNSLVCQQCNDCQTKWAKSAVQKNEPIIFKCCTGLTNFAIPVMIKDNHVASVLGGQVLTELPNEKHLRETAKKLNIDECEYIEEISKIKIVSTEKLQAITDLLFLITNSVANIAYANHKLVELGLNYKVPKNIVMEEWFFSNCEKMPKALTSREFDVLRLIVMGKSNTEIAKELFISVHTVKSHVSSILEKMFVGDRVQLAVRAVREGLL